MKLKELRKKYFSDKANCHICGTSLYDNTGYGLGAIFVLDKRGNFYCTNCDKIFNDVDDRIFDAILYKDEDENIEIAEEGLTYDC